MDSVTPPNAELLYPLTQFSQGDAPAPGVLSAQVIEPGEMPEPYRSLLVHDVDMTGTLEKYFGQSLRLDVLQKRVQDNALWREVLLRCEGDRKAAEFGAIRIELLRFAGRAREAVEASRKPLGAILRDEGILFTSAPSAFLKVNPNAALAELLGAAIDHTLYARRNTLTAGDGQSIAHIIEVLPNLDPPQEPKAASQKVNP